LIQADQFNKNQEKKAANNPATEPKELTMSFELDPEADFIPTPRRTKTKKTEAIRLLADIEFDGPMIEPGREDHYSANARKEEQNKRDEYLMKYGCLVPDEEMLEFVAKYSQGEKVMEPCAGTGLLAYLLNAIHDVDIIASDNQPSKINIYGEVETLDAVETVRKYNDERSVLLLCWPPLLDVDHEAIMRFRGKRLIYIGGTPGGKVGSEKCADMLANNWKVVDRLDNKTWFFVKDENVCVYERKK